MILMIIPVIPQTKKSNSFKTNSKQFSSNLKQRGNIPDIQCTMHTKHTTDAKHTKHTKHTKVLEHTTNT